MRYFDCQAVKVGSDVGIVSFSVSVTGVISGVAVDVDVGAACSIRVASGGGISAGSIVDGAAADGALQALNVSITSRIAAAAFMRGIILH